MRIVIAVGGNALLKEDQRGTWSDQLDSARPVAEAVLALRREGHQVVLPLHALGAMTQGILGYLLQTSIAEIDPGAPTATILTRVRVDDDDPAFDNPTKPVGPFYTEEDAQRLSRERGWVVGEDSGRGWRCMVASPRPVEILELDASTSRAWRPSSTRTAARRSSGSRSASTSSCCSPRSRGSSRTSARAGSARCGT